MTMPKELTHWILAERALAGLKSDSRLRRIILDHHDCYLGGAVLPDTLLHLFRGPYAATARDLAARFHDTPGNCFSPLISAEQRFPDGLPPDVLACMLGVISHMLSDIVFHPFVYSQAGPDAMGLHYRIETEMDVYFLKAGAIAPANHVADLLTPSSRPALTETCALVFDPDGRLPRQALEHALDLHCRFQRMYDSTFWKLLIRFVALLAGKPFSDQRHLFYPLSKDGTSLFGNDTAKWRHPVTGELNRTPLKELADAAVRRTTTLFERIETAGALSEALSRDPGENLLTGIHGACLKEMVNS